MAHITNNYTRKQFGRSAFLVLRFFPLCCVVAAEGVKFWWVSTWSPVSPVSIGCVTPGSPSRSLPQTFVLPQALERSAPSSCVPCQCQEQINSLLSSFTGGFAVPHVVGALPYFTSHLYKNVPCSLWTNRWFHNFERVRFHFGNKPGCKLTQSFSPAKILGKLKGTSVSPGPDISLLSACFWVLCRMCDHRQECRTAPVTVSPHGLSAAALQSCPKTGTRGCGTTSTALCGPF